MEATSKQKGFIYAELRRKGQEISQEKIENLSCVEASEWIDRLLGKQKAEKRERSDFNQQNFGLACKLVIQQWGFVNAIDKPDTFLKHVRGLHSVMERARTAIELAPSSLAERMEMPGAAR